MIVFCFFVVVGNRFDSNYRQRTTRLLDMIFIQLGRIEFKKMKLVVLQQLLLGKKPNGGMDDDDHDRRRGDRSTNGFNRQK